MSAVIPEAAHQATADPLNIGLILDSIDLPIIVVDCDVTVVRFNAAAAAVLSLASSDAGRPLRAVPMLAQLTRELHDLCERVVAGAPTLQRRVRGANGSWFLVRIVPYLKDGGEAGGAVITVTNVTGVLAGMEQAIIERQHAKAILNTVGVPLLVLGADLTVRTANRAFFTLFDVSRDETVGVQLFKLGEGQWDIPELARLLEGCLHGGKEVEAFETEGEFPSIGRKTVLLTAHPLPREPKGVPSLLLTIEDVTARKRAESALKERTAQFETLLNEAPLGVFLVDANFRIRQVNPTALPVFGSIGDVVGRDFEAVMHVLWPKAYADEIVQRFRRTLETGEPYATPERIEARLDTGVTEYYEWQIHRIPLPDGSRGVVCYFRDISRHVLAKQALAEIVRRVEEVDRRKDEFIAMLAHELRNPLAAIGMSAELLRRAQIDDKNARIAVPAIERQTRQLRRLADDLLDTARALHGKLKLRREPVDLLDLAKTVAADHLNRLQQMAVRIEVAGDEVWIDADPARVQQLIGNLAENAFKYGGKNISIRVSRDDRFGRLVVQDDGQGIPADLLPNLFEPFVQGQQSLEREQGGLGLGLALAHRLSSLHGGGIEAHSDGPGRGSTFAVFLPLAAKPALQVSEDPVVVQSKQRILIVEDQEDARMTLRMLLETDGHEVSTAGNGREAMDRLADFHPDIALVDIGLPGLDGYEIARRVRKLHAGKRIKLIALTGYGGLEDRERAEKSGFDMHLTKPVSYEQLVRALDA